MVGLSEHWLQSPEAEGVKLENFGIVSHYCRTSSSHGGSLTMLHNRLQGEPLLFLNNLSSEGQCEISGISLVKPKLIFINIYRPPAGDFHKFLETMNILLLNVDSFKNSVVISGDFNVRFNTTDYMNNELCNLMKEFGLDPIVTFPTRDKNCLDNIFTNIDQTYYNVCPSNFLFSDHLGIRVELNLPTNFIKNKIVQKYRPVTRLGKFMLYNSLNNLNWNFINDHTLDVDTKFKLFISEITTRAQIYFPEKIVKTESSYNNCSIKWFDEELREMRRTLQELNNLYCVIKNDETRESRNNFRTIYRNKIKEKKTMYNNKAINMANNKTKAMWKIINTSRPSYAKNLKKDITDCDINCDTFNKYFSTIASSLNSIHNSSTDVDDPLEIMSKCKLFCDNYTVPDVFSFSMVSTAKVRDIVTNLKNSNSFDIYDLNVTIVKSIIDVILSPLTKLINLCLQDSIYPDCLKTALVIPIFKSGDKRNPSNYRPISLLPIFSKIIEKIMYEQLSSFFETNHLLSDSQFGFRKNSSTTQAVLSLVESMGTCLDKGEFGIASFLDLTKAFDCVSHDILIKKLNKYFVSPSGCKLLSSFLARRQQIVKIGSSKSNCLPVNWGVPQGSVLGPLLFLIFINDFPSYMKNQTVLFADDTTLLNKNKSLDQTQISHLEAHSKAKRWFSSNSLTLNSSKTVNMLVTLKKVEVTDPSFSNTTKFLGVHIESNLKWNKHGEITAHKLCKNIFVLRNLTAKVSSNTLRVAYFALIHSHLSYGILIWGHSSIKHRLFQLQRKSIRLISNLNFRDDCKHKFIEHQILTLPSLYVYESLLYIKQNIKNYLCHIDIHKYDTRNKSQLCHKTVRLTRLQNSSEYHGIKFFNALPSEVQKLDVSRLKLVIKKFLIVNAFYSFEEFLDSVGRLSI